MDKMNSMILIIAALMAGIVLLLWYMYTTIQIWYNRPANAVTGNKFQIYTRKNV
jgi:hypothetical protein